MLSDQPHNDFYFRFLNAFKSHQEEKKKMSSERAYRAHERIKVDERTSQTYVYAYM